MSITVKFTVNGHSAEVTAEYVEALGPQVDAAVKALQSVPCRPTNQHIPFGPASPNVPRDPYVVRPMNPLTPPSYPPGTILCNVDQGLVRP